MDRIIERFEEALKAWCGPEDRERLGQLVPEEMQGYGGVLRGAFGGPDAATTVRLTVNPWDTDERWTVMVAGRRDGESQFWEEWLPVQPLCRIPFLTDQFQSQCSLCGDTPCLHGAALTLQWLTRAVERRQLFLLFFNRRGMSRAQNLNARAIARVPMGLGTNLDRTRKELLAIVEAALKAAGKERDNLFGGGDEAAHSGDRP
ncbi:MAG: hypothetical protein M1272_04220 [Firmicutes bacterium]|nr:hypothetical protein [Bacillota bacterium]